MNTSENKIIESFLGASYQLRSQALAGQGSSYPLSDLLPQLDSSISANSQLDSSAATTFLADRIAQIHTVYDFQPLSMYLFSYHSTHSIHQSLWKIISRYPIFKDSLIPSDQNSLITFFQVLYAQFLQNYISKEFSLSSVCDPDLPSMKYRGKTHQKSGSGTSDYGKAKNRYETQLPETKSYLILSENTITLPAELSELVSKREKIQAN
ncbi:MAG TPA: hypothetical protein PKC14_03980 [Candidatus Absconditabacterales bacterium]|nr:hypothetical protein [Candidatus Absconditabacterales bacterium]